MCEKSAVDAIIDKISNEFEAFKTDEISKPTSEVFDNAYRITSYKDIVEAMYGLAGNLSDKEINILLKEKTLLPYLYKEWLDYADDSFEELEGCVKRSLKIIIDEESK